MEEMGSLLSETPYSNNSGYLPRSLWGGSSMATHGGPQHLFRELQGIPLTLIIIMTFQIIVRVIMKIINIYILF